MQQFYFILKFLIFYYDFLFLIMVNLNNIIIKMESPRHKLLLFGHFDINLIGQLKNKIKLKKIIIKIPVCYNNI